MPDGFSGQPFTSEPMGFFTDVTLCIGCKACEVACKEWNQLPATNGGVNELSGESYDNTRKLDGEHWRHVVFVEDISDDRSQMAWRMMSDVCKHCVQAGCLEVCPTGAIIRTEYDTVVIQNDVCNGCRACIAACPFDVIDINPVTKTAQKCTLCYDRLQIGMPPACAKACPTESISFGTVADLQKKADARLNTLHQQGLGEARLYGRDENSPGVGGLNSFFLIVGEPEKYGLPSVATLPSRAIVTGSIFSGVVGIAAAAIGFLSLRARRMVGRGDATQPVTRP